MPSEAAAAWHERQSRISRAAAVAVGSLYAQVDPDRIAVTWREQTAKAERVAAAAQLAAAAGATAYVERAVREAEVEPAPFGKVTAASFVAPVAAPLLTIGFQSLTRIGRGMPPAEALRAARAAAGAATQTAVADAGSDATSVAMILEPNVIGYVRVLTPPSCGRCAILAGRIYRVAEPFARHPQCDCTHEPMVAGGGYGQTGAGAETLDAKAYFDSLTEKQQNRLFGKAESDDIRDGADIAKRVNVPRDKWRAKATAERERVRKAEKAAADIRYDAAAAKSPKAKRKPMTDADRAQMKKAIDEVMRNAFPNGYVPS